MTDKQPEVRDPFVAPSSSPQAPDRRTMTDPNDEAPRSTPASAQKQPKADDADGKDTRTAAEKRADKAQAVTDKADRQAERGRRPSAYAYGQQGIGNPTGDADGPGTRTWAHRQCGTEIEVPADQSHPAESKCMGCRMDVSPADWIMRE